MCSAAMAEMMAAAASASDRNLRMAGLSMFLVL